MGKYYICAKVPSPMCWKSSIFIQQNNTFISFWPRLAQYCNCLERAVCITALQVRKLKKENNYNYFLLLHSLKAITAPEVLKQIQPSMQYFFPLRVFKVSQGLSRSPSKVHRIFCRPNIYWRLSVHFKADGRPLLLQVLIRQFVLCFVSHLVSHPCRS